MNEENVRRLLRRKVKDAGSLAACARGLKVDVELVSVALRGRPPGPTLLDALELEKVVDYRRKKGAVR
jgi:hypothetical protein